MAQNPSVTSDKAAESAPRRPEEAGFCLPEAPGSGSCARWCGAGVVSQPCAGDVAVTGRAG